MAFVSFIFQAIVCYLNRDKSRNQRVIEYIDECLVHMKNILFLNDRSKDEVEYSRGYLQTAHQNIFCELDGVASAQESDIIRKSLISARVFYHAAKHDSSVDKRTERDYEGRYYAYVNDTYSQAEFRRNSYEVFLRRLVKDREELTLDEQEDRLRYIRQVCREDILRIETLQRELKSRLTLNLNRRQKLNFLGTITRE